MSSCAYANILGEPGKGVHSSRIGPFALADTIATIIAAIITAYVYNINVWYSLIGWFVAGEVLHWIFGVRSAALVGAGLTRPCF
jgi:hypothetical protein